MTLFVDASALIAVIAHEPERERFVVLIDADSRPIWSAMACWEAVAGLRHSQNWTIERARDEVAGTAELIGLHLTDIGVPELTIALDAYQAYGKGRHPAGLNMGDCFAYACAKTNDARLLYKGDDFARTDLA